MTELKTRFLKIDVGVQTGLQWPVNEINHTPNMGDLLTTNR
jgi:hypothetical protein